MEVFVQRSEQEIKHQANTETFRTKRAAQSKGCLNNFTKILPFLTVLLSKVQTIRRKHVLISFATLIMLLAAQQWTPNPSPQKFRSVAPFSDTLKPGNKSKSLFGQNFRNEGPADHTEGVKDNLHSGNRVKDVGYKRSKCFSTSGQPRNHTCAPSVLIAGYGKCGTSALYFKLTRHPEIVAHPSWKEYCPTKDSLEAMWSWFEDERTPVLEDSTADGLLLNGCIGIHSYTTILRELQQLNPNLKLLATIRNYADWAYSYYGFRCHPGYDKGCEKLRVPTSPGNWKKTRSPDDFAKVVKETIKAGKSPYKSLNMIRPNANLFRPWLESLVDIVGRDAIKIIKQEDLAFSPQDTLEAIANFLGIDVSRFDDEAYSLVSNTNQRPARLSSIEENSTKNEISAKINSGIGIHQDTRVELNNFWMSECRWLRDNFDVHFEDVC